MAYSCPYCLLCVFPPLNKQGVAKKWVTTVQQKNIVFVLSRTVGQHSHFGSCHQICICTSFVCSSWTKCNNLTSVPESISFSESSAWLSVFLTSATPKGCTTCISERACGSWCLHTYKKRRVDPHNGSSFVISPPHTQPPHPLQLHPRPRTTRAHIHISTHLHT